MRFDKSLKILDAMGLCMIVESKRDDIVRKISQEHLN